MAAAAMAHSVDAPTERLRIRRPVRLTTNRNPILWQGGDLHWPDTEYVEKYPEYDQYRKLQQVSHIPQIAPRLGNVGDQPSVYKNDFIPLSTSRPVQNRPEATLDFWNEYTEPVTSYREMFVPLPRAKREAIARRGDHWITGPDGFETSTTQREGYPLHGEYTKRSSMKKDVPYQRPDVPLQNQTTHLSDFLWKHESPRASFRPNAPAVIPAPFDSDTTMKETYVAHDARHYEAAFADLDLLQPRSARPQPVDGELVIPKRRGKPSSPTLSKETMQDIDFRTKMKPESSIMSRLEALKSSSSRQPRFDTTYTRSYDPSFDKFKLL